MSAGGGGGWWGVGARNGTLTSVLAGVGVGYLEVDFCTDDDSQYHFIVIGLSVSLRYV